MSDAELHHMCDIAASIGKEKGLDENFGMGAKVASLPKPQNFTRKAHNFSSICFILR
jgi:hypothetical protein